MGLVTPLGLGVEPNWTRLIAGASGIRRVKDPRWEEFACQVAGEVPEASEDPAGYDPHAHFDAKTIRRMDRFIQFARVAAREAISQAGWPPEICEIKDRIATVIASGIGGLPVISETAIEVDQGRARRLSPFTVPSFLPNLAAGQVSIEHGLAGPIGAPSTACAAGAQAIGDAARLIRAGEANLAIAGGTEASIHPVGVAGSLAARAMATGWEHDPASASRPFDAARSGFVMGEGSGIVVLERRSIAESRGAKILGILLGYGASADAFHVTAADPEGIGAERAMRAALSQAGISSGDIGYLNAHSTSTVVGDAAEAIAVKRLFGERGVPISSTKSSIGHLLGAAGAVEAIYTLLAIREETLPRNLNFQTPDDQTAGLDVACESSRAPKSRIGMSNAFGFGGVNSSLILYCHH